MNFSYELSRRASNEFRRLETWLAEEVLDELELLCAEAIKPRIKDPAGAIHDIKRVHGSQVYYVFIRFGIDPARRMLRINSIGTYQRTAARQE